MIIKSFIFGLIIGALFFLISPLGLGIAFIENLRPVLIPGVSLVQVLGVNTSGIFTLLLALFCNVLIYSLAAYIILLIHKTYRKQNN